jgi:competence protein ComEA
MRRALWNGLAACVAIVALSASPAALAAKKKTPTPAAEASSASTASDGKAKTEKVNLNTADEKTIAGAKGVGEKLAKELVKNRPYKTWEDVSKVKGVGSGKKLESLKRVLKLSEGVGAATGDTAKSTEVVSKPTPSAAGASGATGAGASSSSKSSSSSASKSSEKSSSSKLAPGTKININTATKEELDALPEIGPVKAQAIVDYRTANGNFAAPEDIMKVPGIKEGTFAKIKGYIVVK